MEYTKGEWEVRQLPITKEVYVACGAELIAGGLTEANAHLIAKAPRLYEACKLARHYLKSRPGRMTPGVRGILNNLIDALTKAEGK